MLRLRRFVVVATLAFGCLGLAAADAVAAPSKPKISWSKCFAEFGPFECGTVQVPLDYDGSAGGTISIALVRLPATDASHRIGSLFLNPGGPGGSGVDFTVFAGPFLFTPEVRARFDLVGFDPRGIARSTALRCFGNEKQWAPYFTPFAFPLTAEEEQVWIAADLYLDGACAQRGDQIIDHMSTANVARDLDVLRQAVGDDKLTYYGVSYGSYLGQVYANMFPGNFRALVIDGILDPIAWVNAGGAIPFSTRLRSDAGAMATLNEFFRLCDLGGPRCAFGPHSASRFAEIATALLAEPTFVNVPDVFVGELNYSIFIAITLGGLYNSPSWESFDDVLASIAAQVTSPVAPTLAPGFQPAFRPAFIAKRGFPRYVNAIEGFPAVACSDSENPDSYAAWSAAGAAADAAFGYFGRIWTWASSICAQWPGADADRYTGPFTTLTASPVLVVGTQFDPATRYEGALTVAGLLPSSRLLTVHGWGHTSLFLSACADEGIARYLVDVTLPAPGTVCEQDHVPFSGG
jgi:pimeloyl-ACP methyl ester carboxylesterase